MSKSISEKTADMVRILSAAMVEKAASGHPGGAMGGADFVTVLYTEFLNYDASDTAWPLRDRFFLDPGHMSPMLYSILTLMGNYSIDDIKNFRQWESVTPGHPEHDVKRGVENTSGPLGLGHSMAVGCAIAERFLAARFGETVAHKTYAYISDGGIQEEISQGVGRLAGHLGLSNFIMYYDSNDVQLSTFTRDVSTEDTVKKYEAWNWRVEVIDGHDHDQIRKALKNAIAEKERPCLIIGKTIMGKGARTKADECYERQVETHGMPLSKAGACIDKTIEYLGGDPKNPFQVFPDVSQYCAKIREEKTRSAAKRKKTTEEWAKENPALAKKFDQFLSGKVPQIDFSAIEQKPGIATRAASGKVLSVLSQQVENMVVASADLANSDNTDSFLKNTTIFRKGDFSGKFLQVGVAELTMAAVMNGMALHGGVIPACGTFFVFSDYMKPAVRLAALMQLPVKYIWTHDSFRVGEDGPTHEPIEQEAQIRLIEKMNNLEGKRSMLVLRPGDAAEATAAWKLALENTHSPTALILSRQPIADLPVTAGPTRFSDALQASRGAYAVLDVAGTPDCVFVANGSEVSTLIAAAQQLKQTKNLNIRVVSAPSEGLYFEQNAAYREKLIPVGVPVFGLTAGLPSALEGFMGPFGKVVGMSRFGASAPFKVLDEKFGYTPNAVVGQVAQYLDEYKQRVDHFFQAVKRS
jgi:transketolase